MFVNNFKLTPESIQSRYKAEIEKNVDLSRLGTGLAALLAGRNVNVADNAADNALHHNFVNAAMATVALGHVAYETVEIYNTQGQEATLDYLKTQGLIEVASGLVGGPAAKAAWKLALKKVPMLRQMVEKLVTRFGAKVSHKSAKVEIKWGKGIKEQGMPWEDYFATKLDSRARLPDRFKTFDFYDRPTRTAISAKTLNTPSPTYLSKPKNVYSTLKTYIDKTVSFKQHELSGVRVTAEKINFRKVEVAIPKNTNSSQWQQLHRAVEYGKKQNVEVNITVVK